MPMPGFDACRCESYVPGEAGVSPQRCRALSAPVLPRNVGLQIVSFRERLLACANEFERIHEEKQLMADELQGLRLQSRAPNPATGEVQSQRSPIYAADPRATASSSHGRSAKSNKMVRLSPAPYSRPQHCTGVGSPIRSESPGPSTRATSSGVSFDCVNEFELADLERAPNRVSTTIGLPPFQQHESWDQIVRRIFQEELANDLQHDPGAVNRETLASEASRHKNETGLSVTGCDTTSLAVVKRFGSDSGKLKKAYFTSKSKISNSPSATLSAIFDEYGRAGWIVPKWFKSICLQSSDCLRWWMDLREPERKGRLFDFVEGFYFQVFISIMIGLNSICIGISADNEVKGTEAPQFIAILEFIFSCTYAIELMLRIAVHHQYYFCNKNMQWNLFDAFLVLFSSYEIINDLLSAGKGFSPGFMRSLRFLKISKVLRVFRLVRAITPLRLILNTLIGSMHALFWTLMMMVVLYYICGLVFLQGAASYLADGENNPDHREELVVKFGSVGAAMRTLFMATSGGEDWGEVYEALSVVGGMYSGLFLCYVAFTVVAFLNVITAVFVEHAIETAKPGREDLVFFQRRDASVEKAKLTELFESADSDGSGAISEREFFSQMADYRSPLRVYLEADGIDANDASLFFSLLRSCCESDEYSRDVEIKAFVTGLMKIRGNATSLDVQGLLWQTHMIYKTMMSRFRALEGKIDNKAHRRAV